MPPRHIAARKQPFNITKVMTRVRAAVSSFPTAAMFELAELGHDVGVRASGRMHHLRPYAR